MLVSKTFGGEFSQSSNVASMDEDTHGAIAPIRDPRFSESHSALRGCSPYPYRQIGLLRMEPTGRNAALVMFCLRM